MPLRRILRVESDQVERRVKLKYHPTKREINGLKTYNKNDGKKEFHIIMAVRMWTHVDLSLSVDSSFFFAYLLNVEDKYIKKVQIICFLLITFWDFAEEIAENFLLVYKRFVFVG